ncbi:hypothetical protein L3X38_000321 [Prunus dulcis]|uniref:Uncharacterized protein n=1 Tax=Prunus dulcis TaxID=3755 RepID=A0AAD4UQK4_PRUDU|nr:hypothetical protein L3X38_000321 [Prunus dulcis]
MFDPAQRPGYAAPKLQAGNFEFRPRFCLVQSGIFSPSHRSDRRPFTADQDGCPKPGGTHRNFQIEIGGREPCEPG